MRDARNAAGFWSDRCTARHVTRAVRHNAPMPDPTDLPAAAPVSRSHVTMEVQSDGSVLAIRFDEPDRRNPTSLPMLEAFDHALARAESDPQIRVVTIGGNGPVFCAGLDLDEILAGPETVERVLMRLGEVMTRLRRQRAVTIATVQGAAIGGGFGFVAAADFAVSHPEAKLGYPAASTGLSPALMSPWLIRRIGPSAARSMLLRGGTISGSEAHQRGIVTDLAARESLPEATAALIATLLSSPPHALTRMKEFLNEFDGSMDDEWLTRAARVSAEVIADAATQARLRTLRAPRP